MDESADGGVSQVLGHYILGVARLSLPAQAYGPCWRIFVKTGILAFDSSWKGFSFLC
jgi:hypothetical protein